MIRRRRLAPLLLLAACAPPPPPPPPVLTLEMEGGVDQNPGAEGGGGARPVAVQLTYLTATARFERADVFALTERERDTLGADSAGSEQFVLAPGERRTVTRELKPGVQALGVVALFRDVDAGATWRALAPVAPHGSTRLALRTERNRVLLAAAAPAP